MALGITEKLKTESELFNPEYVRLEELDDVESGMKMVIDTPNQGNQKTVGLCYCFHNKETTQYFSKIQILLVTYPIAIGYNKIYIRQMYAGENFWSNWNHLPIQ